MKQIVILILVLVVVAGAVYWLASQDTVQAPAVEPADTAEQVPMPADSDYVGLTVAEAEVLASQNDVPFRVVELDGELLMTTRDYREGRINAVVENGVVVSYMVEGAGAATEPGTDGTPDAGSVGDVMDDVEVPTTDHDIIIGLTEAEAEAYAEANDVPFRIGSIDGEGQPVTMDYRPGRITASLEDGVVTSYTVE